VIWLTKVHGLAGWFDAYFEGSNQTVVLSTAPWCSGTHWQLGYLGATRVLRIVALASPCFTEGLRELNPGISDFTDSFTRPISANLSFPLTFGHHL